MFKDLLVVLAVIAIGASLGIAAAKFQNRQEAVKQILVCSTGVGAPGSIVGVGRVEFLGEGRYRIRMPYMPDQFVDKGMMDLCVIANPKQDAR